jgi:hypothetical protein
MHMMELLFVLAQGALLVGVLHELLLHKHALALAHLQCAGGVSKKALWSNGVSQTYQTLGLLPFQVY